MSSVVASSPQQADAAVLEHSTAKGSAAVLLGKRVAQLSSFLVLSSTLWIWQLSTTALNAVALLRQPIFPKHNERNMSMNAAAVTALSALMNAPPLTPKRGQRGVAERYGKTSAPRGATINQEAAAAMTTQ